MKRGSAAQESGGKHPSLYKFIDPDTAIGDFYQPVGKLVPVSVAQGNTANLNPLRSIYHSRVRLAIRSHI
jgi:hypothetical protein